MFNHIEAPTLPTLKREQNISGKRWYITPEGNKYPSITTVLGQKEKPHLINWRAALGEDKADKETKRCAERGTAIHELVEKYLKNEPYPAFTRGYKAEYIGGFNQLKPRLNHIDNIRVQEATLYSDELKIAGTVDCIGEYDDVLCVIDFKTSNNNKTHEMVEDYYLQCTAYALMWYEMTGQAIDDVAIVMYVEKGLVPLLFRRKIDKYISPLVKRINEYNKSNAK